MHFSFHDLVAHMTRTRAYCAGTILGSGTVSNADRARGVSCLAERRAHRDDRARARQDAVHEARRHDRDRDARRRGRRASSGASSRRSWARREALHATGAAPRAWRVRIALAWKGVAARASCRSTSARRAATHRRLPRPQPAEQVPVLELDEPGRDGRPRRITQSMAILEYLEERFPAPPLLPAEPWLRARARQLAEIVNSGIQPLPEPRDDRSRLQEVGRRSGGLAASTSSRAASPSLERAAARDGGRPSSWATRRRSPTSTSCRSSTPRAASASTSRPTRPWRASTPPAPRCPPSRPRTPTHNRTR